MLKNVAKARPARGPAIGIDRDLAYTPAVELARLIRAKAVSPVEVMANALERIEAVNPGLNCFAFVYAEEAMAKRARPSAHSAPAPRSASRRSSSWRAATRSLRSA